MPNERKEGARYTRRRANVEVARHHARQIADAWGVPDRADDLALVVSELFTNAVIHAKTGNDREVEVTYRMDAARLRVEVRDAGDGMPTLTHDRAPGSGSGSEHGRGLLIVAAVSDAWGVTVTPGVVGKAAWAEWNLVPETEAGAPTTWQTPRGMAPQLQGADEA